MEEYMELMRDMYTICRCNEPNPLCWACRTPHCYACKVYEGVDVMRCVGCRTCAAVNLPSSIEWTDARLLNGSWWSWGLFYSQELKNRALAPPR